ncbi:DUF5916 domain-containing protein, partial [bacterium]|nr:DUF5916 domain-containing protein [bacterium]
QSWGVNFSRRRISSNERTYFALESRIHHGTVSVFGRLQGLRFPKGTRRIELQPYVLGSASMAPAEFGDPFFDGSDFGSRAGLDIRIGLGGSYTLDATINPDFGQVEVDPAVINLTAFETFFREKRPFFVEDAQIFDFNLSGRRNRLFYSRRIGREPQGAAPDDVDYESIPTQTTILGAAKLTGRSPGGLSVGTLVALAAPEDGHAFVNPLEQDRLFPVEPRTLYGAGRVRQDFRDGASQIGAIATATHRDLPSDGSLDFLTSNAYTFGVDFEHNWGGSRSRNWALTGHFAGSHVKGSTEAIQEIQTSSNHYFQRPDASRFSVDSSATKMSGREWELELSRRSAKHWTGRVWIGEISPGFEINDLGFSTSGERITTGGRLSYQEITPGRLFRNYEISMFTFHHWRHELFDDLFSWSSFTGAYQSGQLSLSGEVQFLNYWGLDLEVEYSPRALSSTATRGGPLMVRPATVAYQIRGNTDRRKDLIFEPSLSFEDRT